MKHRPAWPRVIQVRPLVVKDHVVEEIQGNLILLSFHVPRYKEKWQDYGKSLRYT